MDEVAVEEAVAMEGAEVVEAAMSPKVHREAEPEAVEEPSHQKAKLLMVRSGIVGRVTHCLTKLILWHRLARVDMAKRCVG